MFNRHTILGCKTYTLIFISLFLTFLTLILYILDTDFQNDISPILPNILTSNSELGEEYELIQSRNEQNPDNVKRATFFTICRNEDLTGMLSSIKDVEGRFNSKHHYPWIFANDKLFTEEFKTEIINAVSGPVIFTHIPGEFWNVPKNIDKRRMKSSMMQMKADKVLYGDSVTYRQMCRFNSGFFYKLRVLDGFKWYWRVEPDIKFACDIVDDPFKVMEEGKKIYGFVLALTEDKKTIRQLWTTTVEYFESRVNWTYRDIENNSSDYVPGTSLGFIEHDADENRRVRGKYNLCHYWSNFEIADLDFFKSEAYNNYFDHLDRTGNFFYERWGDAPVHSLALSYLVPADKIQYFDNTGYSHSNIANCPRVKNVFKELNCNCPRMRDFSFKKWSCVPRFFKGLDLEPPHNVHN